MSGVSQAVFIAKHLNKENVTNKNILDVGSRDYNGSIRPLLEHWSPKKYTGIDIVSGPGVDLVLSAVELKRHFGENLFDILVSIEMLEHAKDWQLAIYNMKQVLVPGGTFILTTRSPGFPCHGFPDDFWRFTPEIITNAFSDFEIISVESDPVSPGVFIAAKKPANWSNVALDSIPAQSIVTGELISALPKDYKQSKYYKKLRTKILLKDLASKAFISLGKVISKLFGLK